MRRIALLGLMLALSEWAFGQFTITGEIRPRAEYRHGFKSLAVEDTDAAFFVEQRSRIYFDYNTEKYSFSMSVQDIRLWGENPQIFKSDNGFFNVFEAWGAYHFNESWKIKVGRQALDYDNARILGNLAWAQQSRSHDVALITYAKSKSKFHLGAAFNQEDVNARPEPARLASTFYSGVNNYKTMQYAWFNQGWDKGELSVLVLNNGIQSPDSMVHFSQTSGLVFKQKMGGTSLMVEGYYQSGKAPSGDDLAAYMLAVNLGWKIGGSSMTIGGDYLSGQDGSSDQNTVFTPLYGTNHKFYGLMDYFYVGNGFNNVGLIDGYVKFGFKLSKKSTLNVHCHQFIAQTDLTDQDGNSTSNTLGTELDLVYNLNIDPAVNLKVGYSQMFATNSMELVKNGSKDELNNWAWVMLTIKPTLFKKDID